MRLGRCLETLYPCDQIVVIDRGSVDGTVRLARQYGAKIVEQPSWTMGTLYSSQVRSVIPTGWILCLDPCESLSESLAASLFQWKSAWTSGASAASSHAVFLREETNRGWVDSREAKTRLVPADWERWEGRFPASDILVPALEGALLRFAYP